MAQTERVVDVWCNHGPVLKVTLCAFMFGSALTLTASAIFENVSWYARVAWLLGGMVAVYFAFDTAENVARMAWLRAHRTWRHWTRTGENGGSIGEGGGETDDEEAAVLSPMLFATFAVPVSSSAPKSPPPPPFSSSSPPPRVSMDTPPPPPPPKAKKSKKRTTTNSPSLTSLTSTSAAAAFVTGAAPVMQGTSSRRT